MRDSDTSIQYDKTVLICEAIQLDQENNLPLPTAVIPTTVMATRTGTVMEAIRSRISSRKLATGQKLPSIRTFAKAMQVSPSTVVEAYDRLTAEGIIRARPGSGFYVVGGLPPLALADVQPRPEREIDPLWVARQSLDGGADMLRPGCGWLPANWLPNVALRRSMRALARGEDALLSDYGATRGLLALRQLLARQFASEGIETGADQLVLTSSGTQAIDLICRFLLQPGDTVLVDDPCYFNFQALLLANRAKIISVPYTKSGPDVAAFEKVLASHNPRLYITNSALHNPSGATLSPQVAHQVLTLANTHNMTIVEDEIFADFEPEPSTRLATLDGFQRVIRIGSFSKTLSASIRCGYIAARADWIDGLIDLQVATSFGGPSPVAAKLVHACLSDGSYRKHLGALHTRLEALRPQIAEKLGGLGIRPWLMPRGGFYLWCQLPNGVDAAQLARQALREDMVLAPGNVFSAAQSAPDFMRFNVAQMNERSFAILENALRTCHAGNA